MPSGPTPKAPRSMRVRTRLTLAFLVMIAVSWGLSTLSYRYFLARDLRRVNEELAARGWRQRFHREGPFGRIQPNPPGPPAPPGEPPAPPPYRGPDERGPDGPDGRGGADGPDGRGGAGGPDGRGGPGRPGGFRGPLGLPGARWGLEPAVFRNLPVQATIGILVSLLGGWWLSRRFTRPLAALAEGARAFRRRRFSHRIPIAGSDEFAEVAAAMNGMADEVGRQIAALEEDARRRRQVLADVAHELRSPVATLEAMAVALRDGVASQPERRAEALRYMLESASRMRRLVNDLLEVARLDLHEVPLVCAPVDLREIAEDVVYTHRQAAADAGQRLLAEGDGPPIVVEADRLRLSQVLDNLVGNAIAYAGRGAEIRVRVTENPPGLVVRDTGAGIAPVHLPFIFDPFYRADTARTPGDSHSGLGLRIARGLVEAHGGALTLESEEGRGTRVTITLPVPAGNDAAAIAPQRQLPSSHPT